MRKSSLVTLVALLTLAVAWCVLLDRAQTPPANAGQKLHDARKHHLSQCVQRMPDGTLAEVYC